MGCLLSDTQPSLYVALSAVSPGLRSL